MNEVSRQLMSKIDAEVEKVTKGNPQMKISEAAQPFIDKFAAEAGIDRIDLFVDYMDHVAISSKRMAMNNSEKETIFSENDLESSGMRLY